MLASAIPILRESNGLIGAICIDVDVNYFNEAVLEHEDRLHVFICAFCKPDMKLDENILSRDEYQKALA